MKKILKVSVVALICVLLVGCGSSKPSGLSDETYEAGIEILRITDDYLDHKIDQDKAKSEISSYVSDFGDDEEMAGFHVRQRTKQIQLSLYPGGSDKSVKESRTKLAESLGK